MQQASQSDDRAKGEARKAKESEGENGKEGKREKVVRVRGSSRGESCPKTVAVVWRCQCASSRRGSDIARSRSSGAEVVVFDR